MSQETVYGAIVKFLEKNGHAKAKKALLKECEVEPEEEGAPDLEALVRDFVDRKSAEETEVKEKKKKKKDKERVQEDANGDTEMHPAEVKETAPASPKPKKKKRVAETEEKEAAAANEDTEEAEAALQEVKQKKKKKKTDHKEEEEEEEEEVEEKKEETEKEGKQRGKKNKRKDNSADEDATSSSSPSGKRNSTPFKRVDDSAWIGKIKDGRLKDNSHVGKGGDSWGTKASEDLGKVRGKDFRKEMAKKKRASWKGAGNIDLGVNSVMFDSSDEE
uniref:Srp40 C-terminal domain-containing protein n=1 Tax=Chromera velia CCMP2878 TaxID=1169474 RepID=A0A0G4HJI1_9ALVE|eukprot:Cvel_28276.t1-p1 / transcript=Cvel_28276.t1 / gene=Cvel_28276 / organism=Chromera_velia_CCMP2878 / gene_product=Nucleolar and coiled-body phosphoprotein 1, putative / transcript_product=Nucleolar and coiled-body phosphoprotein 1, putative / location=Cvel_scaffold3664:1407-3869(-) / protein_length=274 / sequence_SO=supercontig / SO=protein_coding / is_pseudo=false